MSAGFIAGARDGALANGEVIRCDVCVIGSGAGGAVLAAGLAERGVDVVVLEEGGHHTSAEFRRLDEAWSIPNLYQERGGRATADLAITVLQGRSVGGGTTVNWTTCFRTPDRILTHWQKVHGVDTLDRAELAPHFDAIEARLGIAPWDAIPPNRNNQVLWDGAAALGWPAQRTARNVRGCMNSGYCGFGCPFDAKQAMHLTFVPDAVAAGARVYADVRAVRIELDGDRAVRVHAVGMDADADRERAPAVQVTVEAERFAVCGGAINSPGLLLRSGGALARGPVGRRTWLHPAVSVSARLGERVDGWFGAPQSVASHRWVDRGDAVGFFLEHAPIHPLLAGVSLPGFGEAAAARMASLANTASLIAIHVDGLRRDEPGGTVSLRSDGRIRLDYPIGAPLSEGFAAAHAAMAEVAFAAGALEATTLHREPIALTSVDQVPTLASAGYAAHDLAVFSAHQMGGCTMGPDPATSVVDTRLRRHGVPNVWVVDGSVLPTGLGVNPSETIYGIAHWAVDSVHSG